MYDHDKNFIITISIIVAVFLIFGGLIGFPKYNVYRSEQRGVAALAEAEYSKKVAIEDARAKRDSATMLAEAEVERAKGVAQANEIIGMSLDGNEDYLRYLWVQTLQDSSCDVVYIPTEANLPLLEATRSLK
jgi:regulator of protease activity HflC (stomatin/prohibitin superfamily)